MTPVIKQMNQQQQDLEVATLISAAGDCFWSDFQIGDGTSLAVVLHSSHSYVRCMQLIQNRGCHSSQRGGSTGKAESFQGSGAGCWVNLFITETLPFILLQSYMSWLKIPASFIWVPESMS